MKTVSICELAAWCGLSERRLRQLAAAGELPAASNGQLPMPAAVQQLFAHFRAAHSGIADERLLLVRAKRKLTERQLSAAIGGGLVPLQVVQEAITQGEHRLNRFVSSDLYNFGGRRLNELEEQIARRAVKEAIQDLRSFVEQTVERALEIERETGAKNRSPENEDAQ